MVWFLAPCPDDAEHDPRVVFLPKGPYTASIQRGLDRLGLSYSFLEVEHHFLLS